ncbi:DNA-binding GntR family transcriptional regulator [Rhodoligotrophos appendicifer]|uniref:GntR family transcriptional regulator n=1 Tax=Rhodoligotrophos appendicifer TaxID=987056 RepID=UPI00118694A5|nr:GntR family transcriptional regulator [Rhodoligotrophos appendicifer]
MTSGTSPIRVVVDNISLRERTTQVLREAILNLHFKPGQKLVERRLCEDTGVSRTCVREALRHLESEGLVMRSPNRGMFVAVVGPDEARQIYEIRAVLEPAMVRHFVARATEKQIALLDAALTGIEKAIPSKDVLSYVHALDTFSNVLADGAGNELARQLIDTLRARITYLRIATSRAATEDRERGTLQALRGIYEALKRRDAEAAATLQEAYVERSAIFAQKVLAELEKSTETQ